jgi:hypothetical protein
MDGLDVRPEDVLGLLIPTLSLRDHGGQQKGGFRPAFVKAMPRKSRYSALWASL